VITQPDLFEAMTGEPGGGYRFIPPYIADHVQADGTAFGDPIEDWVEFDRWLHTPEGGAIANKFLRLAIKMKRVGFEAYGAQSIMEAIRWHMDVQSGPGHDFKVNHNWRRRLTYWAMCRAPELEGFFRTRRRETEDGE